MRIAIAAGEASGDLLGAGLIAALRERVPDAEFRGIPGPAMQAAGCASCFDFAQLNVMGLTEAVARLVSLLPARRRLAAELVAWRPDVMVGVDSPDFMLGLEAQLKQAGVPTVHYVSPSVWAWRRWRVHGIRRSVDRMLTLLPFEAAFYRDARVPVTCVGHPFADELAQPPARDASRQALGVMPDAQAVALLPGSRRGEIVAIAPDMFAAAGWLARRRPALRFVVPAVDAAARAAIADAVVAAGKHAPAHLHVVMGSARAVIAAADAVLVASGTATLETLLVGRPMVVTYKVAPFTWWLGSALLRVRRVSLPNLLADDDLVPEVLQRDATPERLGGAVLALLEMPDATRARLLARFSAIAQSLRRGASARAADAVLDVARASSGRGHGERKAWR